MFNDVKIMGRTLQDGIWTLRSEKWEFIFVGNPGEIADPIFFQF